MRSVNIFPVLCLGMLFSGCSKEEPPVQSGICLLTIECGCAVEQAGEDVRAVLPEDGMILKDFEAALYEGDTVADVLQRVCQEEKIHLETSITPGTGAVYVEGIANLYEFDLGSLSGWYYCVNGTFPSFGASQYVLADGDTVKWQYSCDMGRDIGASE